MRCKSCKKLLRMKNRSGLCKECQRKYVNKGRRMLWKQRKEMHECIECGVKVIPVYPIRCKKCSERQRKYANKKYKGII